MFKTEQAIISPQSEGLKKIVTGFFGLGALLIALHLAVIASTAPYVFSSDEMSACGARIVVSFVTHSFNLVISCLLCGFIAFLVWILNRRLYSEQGAAWFLIVISIITVIMLVLSFRSFHRLTHPRTLSGNIHECAYPVNRR